MSVPIDACRARRYTQERRRPFRKDGDVAVYGLQVVIRNLIVLFLLMPAAAVAQGAASVAGRVMDMATEMPIGFATIVVESAANTASRSGALAGQDGRFVLQGLPPGQFRIRI